MPNRRDTTVDRILELIRSLAAAETDRERTALRTALAAELRAATPEILRTALAAIREQATELATHEDSEANVTMLELMAEQHLAINAELISRAGNTALADRQRAALAAMDGQGGEGDPAPGTEPARHDPAGEPVQPGGGAAPVPDPGAQGGGDGNQPAATDPETPTEGQQAAGTPRNVGALNRGDQGSPEHQPARAITMRVLVDGNVPGFTAGSELTRQTLTEAFINKANSLNSAGAAGNHNVAHFEFTYPEENTLGRDYAINMERIAAATAPQALTAAQSGGLCLPLQVIYDIATVGVTGRPVRDSLTPFRVERGGIQYRLPFDALAMPQGLGVWGQDNDQSVNVDSAGVVTFTSGNDSQGNAFGPKSCLVVDCPGVVEASIYSTYKCLEFANMTARFDTEWVTATNDSSQVAWARFAENQLLSRIFAASKIVYAAPAVASGAGFSAVREMLASYDKVISYYRNRHRLDTTVPLSTILPQWLVGLLMTDVARSMNTSGELSSLYGIALSTIESWFSTRNVSVTWHLDGLAATDAPVSGIALPAQFYANLVAGANVPGWPNAVDSVLYRSGDWLFLDGGTLDIGLVRDSALNLRNRYQTFMETFEGVAFRGLESLRVVMPLVPNGASSGTIAPPVTTDGMGAYTELGG